MRLLAYLLAALLGVLGLVFLFAAGQGNTVPRLVIGVVCLAAAAALVALSRLRPIHIRHERHQTLELTGDVSLENFKCRQCSAELTAKATEVRDGAVFVHCEYCGSEYQIEEAPKW